MRFDLQLFEELDEAYAATPLKQVSVPRDVDARREKATRRIANMSRDLDAEFAGAKVLELGCGHGWQALMLVEEAAAAEVIAVDVRSYPAWETIQHPHVRFIEADMAGEAVVAPDSVDFLISGAVLEHVSQPLRMLHAIYDCLRPGGRAWLYFNLYRGPQASHRYNDVRFPWPHLLFDDEICEQWFEKHRGRRGARFAWVNRLTLAEYVAAAEEIGFGFRRLKRRVTEIDVPLYLRFEALLGRYPALDLETDFATLVLERPAEGEPPSPPPTLPYLDRQRVLDDALTAIAAQP
jgi:SAM-dependent methyltransferase